MIFEAFQPQRHGGVARVGRRRSVTYALSALFHGALIGAGLAYSFWSVDELAPPPLHVTLFSGALPAPPPPPPPPPGASAAAGPPKSAAPKAPAARPKTTPPLVQPQAQPLVQPPPEEPHPASKAQESGGGEKGAPGGEKGGVAGGQPGGQLGSTGSGSALRGPPVRFLPDRLGALQKQWGSNPQFPPVLQRSGNAYLVIAKICVSRTGGVDNVTIMKRADPLLDGNVLLAVKAWRYRPLMEHDISVPFCYVERFDFHNQ